MNDKIKERSKQLSEQMLKQNLKLHNFEAKVKLITKIVALIMALIVLIAVVLFASWFAFKHGAGRLVFDAILALLGFGGGILIIPLFWTPFFKGTTVEWGKQWLQDGHDFRHDYKKHLLFYTELLLVPLVFVLYFVSICAILDIFDFLIPSLALGNLYYIDLPLVAIGVFPVLGLTMAATAENFGSSYLYPDAFLYDADRKFGPNQEYEYWTPINVVWALLHMPPKNKN